MVSGQYRKLGIVMVFSFDNSVVLATLVGVLLLWNLESETTREIYGLKSLTGKIPNEKVREAVQLIVFVGLGTYIALLLANPSTPRQAFAAGLGWVAGINKLAGNPKPASSKKKKALPKEKTKTAIAGKEE